MKKVRITVKKIARYDDLIAEYENPIEHACELRLGQTFVANGWERPEGFCVSAGFGFNKSEATTADAWVYTENLHDIIVA